MEPATEFVEVKVPFNDWVRPQCSIHSGERVKLKDGTFGGWPPAIDRDGNVTVLRRVLRRRVESDSTHVGR